MDFTHDQMTSVGIQTAHPLLKLFACLTTFLLPQNKFLLLIKTFNNIHQFTIPNTLPLPNPFVKSFPTPKTMTIKLEHPLREVDHRQDELIANGFLAVQESALFYYKSVPPFQIIMYVISSVYLRDLQENLNPFRSTLWRTPRGLLHPAVEQILHRVGRIVMQSISIRDRFRPGMQTHPTKKVSWKGKNIAKFYLPPSKQLQCLVKVDCEITQTEVQLAVDLVQVNGRSKRNHLIQMKEIKGLINNYNWNYQQF